MKILLSSHLFHPSVGGTEEVAWLLAHEFAAAGHVVKVVTSVAADDGADFPFQVIRRPGPRQLLALTRWCDAVLQNNISLRTAWPLLVAPRPLVISHHTWMARADGATGWQERVKKFTSRRAVNIAVSKALSEHLGAPSTIIGNPYRDKLFRQHPAIPRDLELVFVGRLVSDKGADLLLEALGSLFALGLRPRLTIIGEGPEEASLRDQSARLGLGDQVHFAGKKVRAEVVQLLQRHRIMIVPSRWREPFGLVALEGIACGCVIIASDGGGLPEAVGPCGITFRRGEVAELSRCIAALLRPDADLEKMRAAAPAHLARHTASEVSAQYLRVLEEAVQRSLR